MTDVNTDTPTHRAHLLQLSLAEIKKIVEEVRTRRAVVVEKIKKAKANSKLMREMEVNKQLAKAISRIERDSKILEEDCDELEDKMNKARGLILEATDGELLLEKITRDATDKTSGGDSNTSGT